MTIQDKIQACNYVINNLLDEQERILYAHENEFIQMNTAQFENGIGSDGKPLKNSNPKYDGVYSLSTQLQNPNKRAGDLYNFFETGNFLRGLEINVFSNAVQFNIFSTGTGSGDKSIFFAGYENLFGISDTQKVNEIVYNDLMIWLRKYI